MSTPEPVEAAADPTPAGPTLTIVAGDNQTANLVMTEHGFPMAAFAPVTVVLKDADGAPLAGEAVAWAVGETPGNMGIQLDPHGTSPLITVTDERGSTTLDRMRGSSLSAFYDSGAFTLVASHGRTVAAANFSVAIPLALTTKITGGDNQSVARAGTRVAGGEARFGPLEIRVRDSLGEPVAGIKVVFAAIGPGCMMIQVTPGQDEIDLLTDAEGVATLDLMDGDSSVCRGCDGDFKIVITAVGAKPVVAHYSVVPQPG